MSANDELAKAQGAAPEEDTIFDKIVRGDIPCKEVYSDDKVLAFRGKLSFDSGKLHLLGSQSACVANIGLFLATQT